MVAWLVLEFKGSRKKWQTEAKRIFESYGRLTPGVRRRLSFIDPVWGTS
jgi:hypothetical protein